MTHFICPNCSRPLWDMGTSLRCDKGHCFDKAKQHYVNLLPPMGSGKRHGDDKLMVLARRELLSAGYYNPFSREVCRLTEKYTPQDFTLLDSGCGEGKYTEDVLNTLRAQGKQGHVLGIDISKDAVRYAAPRCREISYAAASCGAIPMADGSTDTVLNIFSPFVPAEYGRVLKKGGVLLRAYPLRRHMWELKCAVYDTPYENPPTALDADGFLIREQSEVCYTVTLKNNHDIQNLFLMTPYYYKTGRQDQEKLAQLNELTVTLEFGVCVYQKK